MKKIFFSLFTLLAVSVASAQADSTNTTPHRTGVTSSLKQTPADKEDAQPATTTTEQRKANRDAKKEASKSKNKTGTTSTTETTTGTKTETRKTKK